jgi:predicted DNA-binding protein
MSCRILIENPAPFKQTLRGDRGRLVDIPIDEGVEVARFYINAGVRFAGFHHSDIDWYEARQMRGQAPPERYDSLEYADYVKGKLDGFNGVFIPHRVIVYQPPEVHARAFRSLAERGIRDIVLVGKPFSSPPAGVTYRNTVEEMLSYLVSEMPELNLGVVVIPDREGETERLVTKFEAAGKRKLHLIGQFLDSADPMLSFMDALASEFARKGLNLDRLEWNIGLAMFTLKSCTFPAKLLRKDRLACEERIHGLETVEARVNESIRMNLEFAERIKEKADKLGLDVGYSIQPIIERNRDGSIHASLKGAVDLVRQLQRLYA